MMFFYTCSETSDQSMLITEDNIGSCFISYEEKEEEEEQVQEPQSNDSEFAYPILDSAEPTLINQLEKNEPLYEYDKLLSYLLNNVGAYKEYHLILQPGETYKSIPQRGETCKLAALAHAIEHAAGKTNSPFPPLYKEGNKDLMSLRQLAKQHGSKIGEMYSIDSMLKTCYSAGFHPKWSKHDSEDDYINQLKKYISDNHAPIIFFDVDQSDGKHNGFPLIDSDGSHEHSATVIAFYIDKNDKTHFMTEHWGRVFDFNGEELARSTNMLQERRAPETFCKILNLFTNKKAWALKERIQDNHEQLDIPKRMASPIRDDETALKNTIMVVEGAQHNLINPPIFGDITRSDRQEKLSAGSAQQSFFQKTNSQPAIPPGTNVSVSLTKAAEHLPGCNITHREAAHPDEDLDVSAGIKHPHEEEDTDDRQTTQLSV